MKTNDLRHTATKLKVDYHGDKADIIVKIRLNDECKNGHQDFAITADIYKAGRRSDRAFLAGGCCHDEILKVFPEFKIFVNLHLCDASGVPMYAVENGFYHLREGFNKTKTTDSNFKKEFCEYYRMKLAQFDIINESENKLEYAILLKELGILEQWGEEAKEAIKILEALTGNEFVNDSEKSQYNAPKAEDVQNFTKQKENGYYSLENKRKRAAEKRAADKAAKIQKIKDDCAKDAAKHEEERNVKLWLVSYIERLNKKARNRKKGFNLDFSFKNYIYYNHSKTLNFDWLSYEEKMGKANFKLFCDNLKESDFSRLPDNIKFSLEKGETFAKS
jgi:hypothetical protein